MADPIPGTTVAVRIEPGAFMCSTLDIARGDVTSPAVRRFLNPTVVTDIGKYNGVLAQVCWMRERRKVKFLIFAHSFLL